MEKRANNFIDITGQKFGRLTVVEFVEVRKNKSYWKCKCDCGKEKITVNNSLKKGNTKSCGCISKEKNSNLRHGMGSTRFYRIHQSIKTRCLNSNTQHYEYYGGRGVKVCDEWLEFKGFQEMYSSYLEHIKIHGEKNTTIERIDVNGNYCKENCRWATMKEQGRNKRSNVYIIYKGELKTKGEWLEKLNLNRSLINKRLQMGWTIEKAFETPIRKYK